jgi:hypothetical protein
LPTPCVPAWPSYKRIRQSGSRELAPSKHRRLQQCAIPYSGDSHGILSHIAERAPPISGFREGCRPGSTCQSSLTFNPDSERLGTVLRSPEVTVTVRLSAVTPSPSIDVSRLFITHCKHRSTDSYWDCLAASSG